jgi:hypothetical protein
LAEKIFHTYRSTRWFPSRLSKNPKVEKSKKTTSQNAPCWKIYDRGLCFDDPNLIILAIVEFFDNLMQDLWSALAG